MTCRDYLAEQINTRKFDDYDEDEYDIKPVEKKNASFVPVQVYKFGFLMGLSYVREENSLYLNDYGMDRIEKLYFHKNSLRLNKFDTLAKSNGDTLLNPVMSVLYEKSHLFWIDYENGLNTNVVKSACIRTVYKIKRPISLKLVQMLTLRQQGANSSSSDNVDLIEIFKTKKQTLKYPPDEIYTFSKKSKLKESFAMEKQIGIKSKAFESCRENVAAILISVVIFIKV